MKAISLLLFLYATPILLKAQNCTLAPPSLISVDEVGSCSITYSWSEVSGAQKYRVRYKKSGTSAWLGAQKVNDTIFTFSNLEPATSYVLSVQSVCTGGRVSMQSITATVTTLDCQLPTAYSVLSTGSNSQRISVTAGCSIDTLYCSYGTSPDELSNLVTSSSEEVELINLVQGQTYYFSVSTCPLGENNFTPIDSFTVSNPVPNILLILLDDGRDQSYGCNGAPSFFESPNIDRIANEGIRFQNSFVVHSLCAPSRACIATGVYTSRHGVYDNKAQPYLNPELALLPELLHDHGYSTALVGKNHAIFKYAAGYFDYWLEFTSTFDGYDLSYRYNSEKKTIPGYSTDVLSDSAVRFINNAEQPFMLWLSYHAPHEPLVPSDINDGKFSGEEIALKADTARFSLNYPSFIYDLTDGLNPTEAERSQLTTFEMLQSVEDGVGRILDALEAKGQLDNTLIIFTSDNGHMLGEHNLDMKRVAYEPSIRVPMFIRYPQWFAPGTVDTSNFALNIDIAPTILEAAQIPGAFDMDGQSLRNFYSGASTRNQFYYHYWYSTENNWYKLPTIHAVRDEQYILIDYGCSNNVVREFFDLKNDPLQFTNEINNSAFSSLISSYEVKLDSFKTAYADTAAETMIDCFLKHPEYTRESHPVFYDGFVCFPNPASGSATIQNTGDTSLDFNLINELGQILQVLTVEAGEAKQVSLPSSGVCYLQASGQGRSSIMKLMAQ